MTADEGRPTSYESRVRAAAASLLAEAYHDARNYEDLVGRVQAIGQLLDAETFDDALWCLREGYD